MMTIKLIIFFVILMNLYNFNKASSNNINSSDEIVILCPEQPLCPCICSECGPVNIKTTSRKHIYAYITAGLQSNFSYFINDSTFKWDSVDTIALYSSGFDNRISCLAHRNNVKIEFVMEESNIFDNFRNLKANNEYWLSYINTTRLLNLLQLNNVDGYNLDFEYGNRYGSDNQFSNVLKLINQSLKEVNLNYSLSIALATRYGSNLAGQFIKVVENIDYLIIMAYDSGSWPIGSNFTSSVNSPKSIRSSVKNYYIDPLGGVDSELLKKVILALPFYGYATKCLEPNNVDSKTNPGSTIFTNTCIVESKPFQIPFHTLYDSLFYPKNGDGNKTKSIELKIDIKYDLSLFLSLTPSFTSGFQWSSKTSTVFSNFIDSSTGDVWQISFDSPYSIYQKVNQIGVGGVGVWTLDKLRNLPQPLVDSFYYSISRDIIGDKYIVT